MGPGECVASIAFQYGFYPDTIWNREENAPLRQTRENPNVLLAGDLLFIPEKTRGSVTVATGARHVFRRRGVPEIYRTRFLTWDGKPRAGLAYTFLVGGAERQGTLDADGAMQEWIPPAADRAVILLADGETVERYEVLLGHLDPLTELRGVQARLNSLGYTCGAPDGTLTAATTAALRAFQRDQSLEVTGEADAATVAKLRDAYGV